MYTYLDFHFPKAFILFLLKRIQCFDHRKERGSQEVMAVISKEILKKSH